jgi:hypothetical protein
MKYKIFSGYVIFLCVIRLMTVYCRYDGWIGNLNIIGGGIFKAARG